MGSVLDKNSSQVRKRIEKHSFEDEEGEEYEASNFNGFNDYFRRKKVKLQNLDAQIRAESDKPQIFKGIVAHVTGYTQPPLHILHRDIVQYGGGFLQYLDSKTMATHIIASTLPPKKSVDFSRYRIVKPAWITDSISAGKLLPWTDYRVLDEGPRQKLLKFDSQNGLTQSIPKAKLGYKEQTEDSFYTSQLKAAALPSQSLSPFAEKLRTPLRASEAAVSAVRHGTELDSPSARNGVSPITEGHQTLLYERTTPGVTPREEHDDYKIDSEPWAEDFEKPAKPDTLTSEEHNARLLQDPRLRKSSTANPDFLAQYYSESRLHHLSTWKAELKSKMQRLAAENGLTNKVIQRKPGSRRYILHVDFDSFFCAVSLKKHPEYVDKPAVVAHSGGSGSEIASCNYPARAFGIKNGMWMKRAQEMCTDIKVLPYDFPAYEDASRQFYECIIAAGGRVQSVSVDEALVDVTAIVLSAASSEGVGVDKGSIWREQEKVGDLAQQLRKKIKDKTGCAVSIGIGANILQAKVALRRAKPAGQYLLKPEDVLSVIGELTVQDLPGVSRSIGGKLEELGIKVVEDIRDVPKDRLVAALGPKTAERLRDYSRGIDRTEVGDQPPRKSVSAEVNWGIRFISQEEAEEFIYNLCKELERRLVNERVRGKQLTMKIMRRSTDAPLDPPKHLGHGKCDVFNKSVTFGVATHSYESIGKEAVSILRSFKFTPGDLRGLGVQMTKLEPIKVNAAAPDGSQKRLSFGGFSRSSTTRKPSKPEPIDDSEIPTKAASPPRSDNRDPISDDYMATPQNRVHKAMLLAKAGESDSKSKTPLNVSGTQFLMPSHPDPAILAELPSDIRSKLMGQAAKSSSVGGQVARSKSASPDAVEPLPSQIDADVFNALPADMKAEILATYGRKPAQVAAPESPRRERRPPTTPSKPKRGRPRGIMGKAQRQSDAQAGLVQTNFAPSKPITEAPAEEEVEELDPDFLSELPEEVRREVLADYRRRRLVHRSGLDAPAPRPFSPDLESILPGGQTTIQFNKLPPKVSFSGTDVMSTHQVKDMLDAWHAETNEGPHHGDVVVFERYLVRIVEEERDMAKAAKLIKWLDIIVHQGAPGKGTRAWIKTLDSLKAAVQSAVGRRGLAPLKL
ncbi:hypothetical protein S7711_00942 [Stachybotrys chartarum IBT 7711]|uniref:DNA repair protein REV1 n=1 Tax=Stachybotrys chartarum (strain CBS 109288 / IBT 7711) TaxID=1280523 RepID=A0A084B0P1_STACB|nr:hypothetical protein S7711_00942 [Stachybotrys chartarum IBT 7711]